MMLCRCPELAYSKYWSMLLDILSQLDATDRIVLKTLPATTDAELAGHLGQWRTVLSSLDKVGLPKPVVSWGSGGSKALLDSNMDR